MFIDVCLFFVYSVFSKREKRDGFFGVFYEFRINSFRGNNY